ncbi:MAG: hypothetical protein M3Y72_00935 [Acidobacteriota bacterium]|nr:hypothetical protein [Acidobacteriota bacterium]
MLLLNTKTLLVIAALLATGIGLLMRQEARATREEQRRTEIATQQKQYWEQVKKYETQQQPMHMEKALADHKAY